MGAYPAGSLIFDAAGNLLTALPSMAAVVAQAAAGRCSSLTPQAGGGWTQNVLHYFSSTDEAYPNGSLIFDGAGNLYGSTGGEGGDRLWDGVRVDTPGRRKLDGASAVPFP